MLRKYLQGRYLLPASICYRMDPQGALGQRQPVVARSAWSPVDWPLSVVFWLPDTVCAECLLRYTVITSTFCTASQLHNNCDVIFILYLHRNCMFLSSLLVLLGTLPAHGDMPRADI